MSASASTSSLFFASWERSIKTSLIVFWELQQADIYELLSSAPAVIDSYRVRSSAQLTSDY